MPTPLFRSNLTVLTCAHERLAWNFENLSGPYWRFYWNTSGNASLTFEGQEYSLSPESMFLIPPNTVYSTRTPDVICQFYVHFTLVHPYDMVTPCILSLDHLETFRSLCEPCIGLLDTAGADIELGRLAHAIAALAVCQIPLDTFSTRLSNTRVSTSIELMREAIGRKLSNDELANALGMNRNAYINLFKSVTGDTPQNHFRKLCIESACIALQYSDQTIDQIALETGFCDRYHFSRCFKKFRSVGPATYRKNLQGVGAPNHRESD